MNEQRKRVTDGKLPLPVGRSEWAEIAACDYCIDKTLMIKELVDADTDDLDALAAAARAQIDAKSYEADLRAGGVADILKFGLAFRGKRISLASR